MKKKTNIFISNSIPDDIQTFLIDTACGDLDPKTVGSYTEEIKTEDGTRYPVFEIDENKLKEYIKKRKVE